MLILKMNITKILNNIPRLVIILTLLFSFNILISQYHNLPKVSHSDINNRVIGIRLMLSGYDPYFYFWQPGDPVGWIDVFAIPQDTVTRLTTNPLVTFLHEPFAKFDNNKVALFWFLIEWAAFYLTYLIFIRLTDKSAGRQIFASLIFTGFSLSAAWSYHVSLGQIYILYVFILSLVFFVFKKLPLLSKEISGLLLGGLISLRLPYLLLLVPFIVKSEKKFVIFTLLGLILSFAIAVNNFGIRPWISYYNAMRAYSQKPVDLDKRYNPEDYYPVEAIPAIPVWKEVDSPMYRENSLRALLMRYFNYRISPELLHLVYTSLVVLVSGLIYIRKKRFSADSLFIIGSLLVILYDYFMPARRYNYYDLQYLFPIFVGLGKTNVNYWKSISRTKLTRLSTYLK